MKRVLLVVVAVLAMSPAMMAGEKDKKGKKAEAKTETKPKEAKTANAEINWLTMDELQVKMKEKPKKVYIDMYTDWCGWCKKMDASTFKNPELIKYMNENFYAVKFNAETKEVVHFMGKDYKFVAENRANQFATEMIGERLSFPTSVIMTEFFQNRAPIPGYHDVKETEMFLRYFGDNIYKSQQFPDYQKAFKPTWTETAGVDINTLPGAH